MTKLYRAFPELDGRDDYYCEYMLRTLHGSPAATIARTSMLLGVYLVLLVLTAILLGAAAVVLSIFFELPIQYEDMVTYGVLFTLFSLPYVLCLVVRDIILRRGIRRWLDGEVRAGR